jgi:hypothetical protein
VIVGANPLLGMDIPNQGVVVDLTISNESVKMVQIFNHLFLSFTVEEAQQRLPRTPTQQIQQLSHSSIPLSQFYNSADSKGVKQFGDFPTVSGRVWAIR